MGEIADLIINGDICQICTCEMGVGGGYPRTCRICARPTFQRRIYCTLCKRPFAHKQALANHKKDKHAQDEKE